MYAQTNTRTHSGRRRTSASSASALIDGLDESGLLNPGGEGPSGSTKSSPAPLLDLGAAEAGGGGMAMGGEVGNEGAGTERAMEGAAKGAMRKNNIEAFLANMHD